MVYFNLINLYYLSSISATRNFDLAVYVKETATAAGADSKERDREYIFMSIDRSEYASLSDYIRTKEIKIKNLPEPGAAVFGGKARMDELLGQLEGDGDEDSASDEGSEDDGDYKGGESSHSGDSDDSGSDEDSEGGGEGGGSDGEGTGKKVSELCDLSDLSIIERLIPVVGIIR